MDFHKPEHNTFGFYRTHAKDAEGRRVCIKERGIHRNQTRLDIISQLQTAPLTQLDIISQLQTITLTQEDAGELAKFLYHYSQENTIADYEGDFELYSVSEAVIEASVPSHAPTERVVSASTPWRDLGVEDWQENEGNPPQGLIDGITAGWDGELCQPERVAWTKRCSEQYTADLPSGAVLRVEWCDDDNGWVGRCGSMETSPHIWHGDAQDAIMAWYLDAIERDVAQLRASLP